MFCKGKKCQSPHHENRRNPYGRYLRLLPFAQKAVFKFEKIILNMSVNSSKQKKVSYFVPGRENVHFCLDYVVSLGPFKKYVTGLGGRGSSKLVTNSDKGEGVKPNSDVTAYEKNHL